MTKLWKVGKRIHFPIFASAEHQNVFVHRMSTVDFALSYSCTGRTTNNSIITLMQCAHCVKTDLKKTLYQTVSPRSFLHREWQLSVGLNLCWYHLWPVYPPGGKKTSVEMSRTTPKVSPTVDGEWESSHTQPREINIHGWSITFSLVFASLYWLLLASSWEYVSFRKPYLMASLVLYAGYWAQ